MEKNELGQSIFLVISILGVLIVLSLSTFVGNLLHFGGQNIDIQINALATFLVESSFKTRPNVDVMAAFISPMLCKTSLQ